MLHSFESSDESNPTVKGLKFRNERTECIVFGFVRDGLSLLVEAPSPESSDVAVDPESSDESNHINDNEIVDAIDSLSVDSDETDDSNENDENHDNESTVDTLPVDTTSTKLPDLDLNDASLFLTTKTNSNVQSQIENASSRPNGLYTVSIAAEREKAVSISLSQKGGIPDIVMSYYNDQLLLQTNFLYSCWNDLGLICNEEQLANIKEYRRELVQMGYNPNRLPLYELYRYYFGVAQDMNRALNKWKGSVETFTYYNLQDVPIQNMRRCFRLLTKSCEFCGYHDMDIGKPSPVFILNYENFDWREFPDMNPLIKAAFYVGSWMTDSLEAIHNGVTLMINSRGVGFRDISKAMTLLRAMQKALAMRTNNVFFLNLPSLAKSSMKLFLKIYPKHIQDRLHVCSDTKSLREILRDDQIPRLFGGTLDRDAGGSGKTPCLAELLSAYAEIKDFDHLTLDDDVGFEDYGSAKSGWY